MISIYPAVKLSLATKTSAYYNSLKILVGPIDGGPPIKTFGGNNTKLAWSPDGRALTYLVNREFVPNLWMQPLDGGPAKQLTNFTSQGISSYAWSSDGKQLAVARTTFRSDIVLIQRRQMNTINLPRLHIETHITPSIQTHPWPDLLIR